jgi:hypothetical protein
MSQLRRVRDTVDRQQRSTTLYREDGSRRATGTRIGSRRTRWVTRHVLNGRIRSVVV